MLAGEAAIFWAFFFTGISFLWYNVLGCAVVIATALAITHAKRGDVVPAGPASD
jgi:hypothetical protein